MPSPWTDLLILHGYIADLKLLRRWTSPRTKEPPTRAERDCKRISLAGRLVRSGRLCLGIGDGVLRSQ